MGYLIVAVVIIIVGALLVLNYYPPLGGKSSKESWQRIKASPNFVDGKFRNQIPTSMDLSVKDTVKLLGKQIKGHPQARPQSQIPIDPFDSKLFTENSADQIIWFGHSTLLVKVNEVKILIDPVFSKYASPVPKFGPKRYSKNLPAEVEDLPKIDAVIISHDHYDHLDYKTIRKLRGKVDKFIVPLGVAGHLVRWGVKPENIVELDWWDEVNYQGLTIASTPARHFSGRSLGRGGTTLWSSWVIVSEKAKIYFNGDSGYGPHFKEIGNKYGPFDVTLMESGQYNENWSGIHMMPEETVQANADVQGKLMIPIHWGAFTLALHSWTDPIERVTKAAHELGTEISTPRIGETFIVGAKEYPTSSWWK
ncbi:MBL fold metallo-hydrolase [Cohnella abietis]|uniref:Membrane protein n=1 Tax=Cohnella abietis TaxID=2507935 RepID=A0A3T1DAT8_9BACL|nr:MBL fold metallo-hydrolase [Cohnella abietis]BBI35222.1 membrane protein [Cohnella abietis]